MNKRAFLFFLILASISFSSVAQVPSISWQKCYGGLSTDELHDLKKTSDGGYIFAGDAASENGDVSGNHGSYDGWVVKINNLGLIQWQKCIGGTGADHINSIDIASDGGYIISGYTNSNDGDVSGNHGNSDYWVVKLNNVGTIQWQKCFGGSGFDMSNSIIQTNDGGYIVAGVSRSTDGDVIGNRGSDVWIIKMNNSGIIQWQKCYGGSGDEIPQSIQNTLDGGYIILSVTTSNDGNVFGNHGSYDGWVTKINSLGALQWQKCFGGSSDETLNSIIQTSDGGYIISGSTMSNNGDVSGNHGGVDAWVCKLSDIGNLIWQKSLGGTNQDAILSIIQNSNGDLVVVGSSFSNNGDISGNHGSSDAWICKITFNGILLWQKCIGGLNEDRIEAIEQTSDGGFILGGTTNSNDGDVSGNHGNNDFWVVKLSNSVDCTQPNLSLSSPGCLNTPITLTSDTGIAQIQWYLDGNLISTQQGWNTNGVTVAGGNGAGSALNQLDVPIAVFVDSAKNLIIAETNNNRIVKWDNGSNTGTIVAGGNGSGSAANQMHRPTDVVIDKLGFMYISENQRVVKWRLGATSGTTIAGGNGFGSGSTQFYNPMGLDIDTLGNVYVSDAVNGRIQKFSPGSTASTPGITVVSGLSNSYDVKLDDSLNIFNSDWGTGTIKKSLNGLNNPITVASGLTYPSGVFVDKAGNVYASNQNAHKIEKWIPGASAGIVIAGGNDLGSAPNQLAYPQKIFLDKSGDLFVADGNNYRIQKFSLRNSFTYTPTATGTYTAIVTLFNGCTFASNSVVVTNSSILPDTTKTCGDSVAILNVSSGYSSYQWSNGNTTNSITVSQNGMYNVTVTSPNGCIIKDSSYVSIINGHIVNNDTSICRGDSVMLSASYRTSPVYDNSGNRYETVNIGTQIWTKSNLNTAKYNNGSSIPNITNPAQWQNLTTGAWCWYNNDSINYSKYGKLYNSYAIQDSRSLVPNGWHISTDQDFNVLENYLGGLGAGGKMKDTSNLWQFPNTGATNSSGFSGLPGGYRTISGEFYDINSYGYWWTKNNGGGAVYSRWLSYNYSGILSSLNYVFRFGYSVRFLRDTLINYTYLWSNGSTNQTINVTPSQTTTYYCTISNGITSCIDSVTITVGINPFQDTTKICGDSTLLDAGTGYANYSWNTGDTTQTIMVRNSGFYKVTVTNARGCISSDSTFVSFLSAKIIQNDTTICRGNSITLSLQADTSNFVRDIDGNIYPMVSIGNQTWLQKNLTVSRYRNGDTIPQVTNPTQWLSLTTGAWCWYNNDSTTFASTYGKLYNWYAVNDSRGLGPTGWHVPTDLELSILDNQYGGQGTGGSLKESGYLHWNAPNLNATNISGFTALPGGCRDGSGTPFVFLGQSCYLWSNTENATFPNAANLRLLKYDDNNFPNIASQKSAGFSVRCVKDNFYLTLSSSYLWSIGDTSLSINLAPQETTTYYATVSNGINSCVDSVKVIVPVLDTSITILDSSTTICSNNGSVRLQAGIATSYQWLFNGVPIPNSNTRVDTARQSGLYSVVVTNSLGCTDTSRAIQVNIFSLPQTPLITASGPTTFCSTSNVTLTTTSSNVTYQWYNNGTPLVSDISSSLLVNQSGQYTVSVTNANGCTSVSSPIAVTVNQLPSASISYTQPFCSTLTTAQSVSIIGTSNGTYSVSPSGLSINISTGAITPSASTAGTYTVNYTIAASNSCPAVNVPTSVTITAQPAATIAYSGSPFCSSITSAQAVTRTGTTGGVYTSTPAGLSINSSTGAITPSASTAGTYTITYTIAASNGCTIYTAPTTSVTITAQPSATISYSGPYCNTLTTAQSVIRTGTNGGVYTSTPVGLSINSATGAITPSASTSGTYTVTYTVAASNGCAIYSAPSTSVTITAQPSAAISYGASPYCSSLTTAQSVTRTGTIGGLYTSTPTGLSINSSTGAITPSASTAGTYTVNYTIATSNGCASYTAPSTSVTITAQPSATIFYGASPYCRSLTTLQPVTRSGTTGGVYTSSPAGLSINSSTGAITPSASTAGTYTVAYSISAANGCGVYNTLTSVTITAQPSATISYSGSPYCRTLTTPQPVTRTGTAGGIYTSIPTSLFINSSTGAITPSASTAGTYTVNYTIAASNSCPAVNVPTSVTITAQPAATIAYSGSPFCSSITSAQAVTRTGTTGGVYTSTPAGLSINSTTGAIIPSTSTAGTYTVTYSIASSNGCGVYNVLTSVTITAQPSATISYSGSPYCRTLTTAQPVTRTGTAGGIYTSIPTSLFINSSTGAITPSASTAGTYTVNYTVAASNGCASYTAPSTSVTITAQPSAAISYPSSSYCMSLTTAQPVIRTGTTGGAYSSIPAGLSINSATGAITPSASTAGSYNVNYTIAASNGCGAVTAPTSVTITALPTATISYSGSPFCRTLTTAQPVNRTGATNGTFTSSPAGLSINSISGAITPSLSQVGTYTVFYSVPASSGCATTTFSCSVVISSTLPVGNIAPASGNICEGSTLTLTASGGYLYNWYKNGIVIAGATNSTYQAGTSGTYTVQVFSTNGCNAMGSNSSILTYTKKPIANFSYNNYCIRKPILFTSTSDTINSRPVTYRWSFGDGVGTSTLKNPTYTFMNAGTYNVSLTVRSVLCPSLQSQSIKTIKIDTFIANLRYPNVNVVIPPGIQLTAREFTTNTTYSWSPTTGLNSPSIYNPFFNINTPQQYLITITNPSGCIIKDTLKVNVFTTQDIFVPKGFSPNNDGANDKLFPYIVGLRALNYFQVYNRWGQKVFETNIEGNGWDGKYRGVIQPIETYTWIAEGVGLDGKIVKRSGGTLLMR